MARTLYAMYALVVITTLLPGSSAVTAVGYLGNACNGESLFAVTPAAGSCSNVTDVDEAAGSITLTDFAANEGIFLYSDASCVDMIDQASSDECYLVPSTTTVQSFLSDGGA
ncbi:hypothetical protein ONS95_008962 [Cadophora gregata]|uniref:uncharacterized protein n=1 Tax=Cadophora gregata TaxID=51156 RepID=UPI0026DC986D|nr:uncharacterized protein ONS95_008962 [Cadophora gregata]KAK0123974.1 hypothetical protein ONS95_008962 [Cadophora gregata]KAK0130314.1 hypothetical protein ONS96_000835 [Cadophora gregata f. sp. sojae]